MRKLIQFIRTIYNFIISNRGEINLTQTSANNDTSSGINIVFKNTLKKPKQAGGLTMKHQEPVKLINITQNNDRDVLKKLITEKISRVISTEYNNLQNS